MTTLIERMREELVRRNYAATAIHSYLKAVKHFRSHVDTLIDEVGPDDLRSYHAFLLGTRKLAVNTVVLNICALRFLYIKVLKRRDMKEDLPYPRQARQRWLTAREKELLDIPYVHVVCTLPLELTPLCLRNARILYDLLFRASADTVLQSGS